MAKYKPRRALPPDEDDEQPDRRRRTRPEPSPAALDPAPIVQPTPEGPAATGHELPPVLDRTPVVKRPSIFDPAPEPVQTPAPELDATEPDQPRSLDPAPESPAPAGARPLPPYEPQPDDTSTRILRIRKQLELDEPEERRPRPKVDRKAQQVWRAGRATLTIVSIASVLTVAALLVLAYLLFRDERPMVLVVGLTVLAIALLIYIWRMVWHPRLVSAGTQLIVHNPLRTRVFEWSEVTLVQPGQNGMIIGTDRDQVEAWCVQKGRAAAKRGHRTRADQVADELWTIWDEVDPPMIDEKRGLRIRRARPNETQLLTRMERTTNEHALAHIFPPKRFPYPTADVSRRWQRTLAERQVRVRILEVGEAPAAFIAYDHETVRHLGVLPHDTRRGHGTTLLTFAEDDVFTSGGRQLQLWVLTENRAARAFYRSHGWVETEDRRRSEFPPKPDELKMIKVNKRARPQEPATRSPAE